MELTIDAMRYRCFMVDIETMGKSPNAAILEIGVTPFDFFNPAIGESFKQSVSLESCVDAGLTFDASTVMWWMNSDQDKARPHLVQSQIEAVELPAALHMLNNFIRASCNGAVPLMFGNGPEFDMVILENAYAKTNIVVPWMFYNTHSYRTTRLIMAALGIRTNVATPEGMVAHTAVGDSQYQALNTGHHMGRLRELVNLGLCNADAGIEPTEEPV